MPFLDIAAGESPVTVAYLRFVEEGGGTGMRGCVFVVSLAGDPLEFCFTRVALPTGPLWNHGLALRRAVAELARALFQASSLRPDAVFCLSYETPVEVFGEDIEAQVPLCRVSAYPGGDAPGSYADHGEGRPVFLCWENGLSPAVSVDTPLTRYLESRHRLLEPFERAGLGLEEAFSGP